MSNRSADDGNRYVITLFTSSLPMTVKLAAEYLTFAGVSTFRSRAIEDGCECYRLHLGYFDSLPVAEEVLEQIRPHYPTALLGCVPVADSGSLDDTINTAFTLVRTAIARLVTDDPPAASVSDGGRAASAAPGPSATLTAGQVASVMAPQRYAVQLDWSLQPIAPASIPRLGIFRAYSVYAVSVLRQGCPEHGLRLGFFKNLDGARQVADYVRPHFPHASVVPVSYREYTRASELVRPVAVPAAPPVHAAVEQRPAAAEPDNDVAHPAVPAVAGEPGFLEAWQAPEQSVVPPGTDATAAGADADPATDSSGHDVLPLRPRRTLQR